MNYYSVDVKAQYFEFPVHGQVVDVEDTNVIVVDFDCPGHHAEVTLVGNCLCWEFDADFIGSYGNKKVDILYRDSIDLPLCWIPGTFICGGTELGYALVDIMQNGQNLRKIFDVIRVRNRQAYLSNKDIDMENPYHRVEFNNVQYFFKHQSTLNVDIANLLTCSLPTLSALWFKWTNTKLIGIEEKSVTYISRSRTTFTMSAAGNLCQYIQYELANQQPVSFECDLMGDDWSGRIWKRYVFKTPHLLTCIIASMTNDNYKYGTDFCFKYHGKHLWSNIAGSILFHNIKFIHKHPEFSFSVLSQLISDPKSDNIIRLFEKSCPSLTPDALYILYGSLQRCQQDMQKRKIIWMNIKKWNHSHRRTEEFVDTDVEIPHLLTLNRFTLWNLLCLFGS